MLRLLRSPKGQSTGEYAVLLGLIIAVIIGMQTYVKRGWQARLKSETDAMIAGTSGLNPTGQANPTAQYEPDYLESDFTTTTTKDETKLRQKANNPKREIDRETTTPTGTQTIKASPNN